MLEPTLSLITIPQERARRRPALAGLSALRRNGWIAAAPFLCAALWATATGAAFLVWAVTGESAPLDGLRSGSGLIAAAALTAAALLVASFIEGLPARRELRVRKPCLAARTEARSRSGWLLEEGQFESL
jgi:hypothetical protein